MPAHADPGITTRTAPTSDDTLQGTVSPARGTGPGPAGEGPSGAGPAADGAPAPHAGEEAGSAVPDTEVLIVGAGPAGLTLACDLRRRGVSARIVEAAPGLFPGSRGKGIQPRSQEVFDDLGVLEAMRAQGSDYPRMAIWEDGVQTGTWDMVERSPATPSEPYTEPLLLPQWRTQEILAARLSALGGTVEFGARVTGIVQDGAGVTAEITAPDDTVHRLRARYLVGADGGRSTVRRAVGVTMTGQGLGSVTSLVADVRVEGLSRDHWHVWPKAEGGAITLCPLADTDLFQTVAQFEPAPEGPASGAPEATAEAVRAVIAARTHLTAAQVTDVRWVSSYRPSVALADRFRIGRVFLAGDAAHVHPPTGGQGLNTSIQDAYNLGWKLGQVLRHCAPESLLDTYEEERLPIAAGVLGISTRLYRAAEDNGVKGSTRGRETQQLGITYRDGSLAAEHRTAVPDGFPQAGDRAPQAVAIDGDETKVTVFDALRGPHFTLLAVAGTEPPSGTPAWVRVLRLDGDAIRETYGPGLFLIRPDGHMGLATARAEDVTAYLGRVGG